MVIRIILTLHLVNCSLDRLGFNLIVVMITSKMIIIIKLVIDNKLIQYKYNPRIVYQYRTIEYNNLI